MLPRGLVGNGSFDVVGVTGALVVVRTVDGARSRKGSPHHC